MWYGNILYGSSENMDIGMEGWEHNYVGLQKRHFKIMILKNQLAMKNIKVQTLCTI